MMMRKALCMVLAGIASVGVLSGCGSSQSESQQASVTTTVEAGTDAGHVDYDIEPEVDDPYVVGQAVVGAIYGMNPAVDETPQAGLELMRDKLTGPLLDIAGNFPRGDDANRAYPKNWERWKKDGSYVQVASDPLRDQVVTRENGTVMEIPYTVRTFVVTRFGDRTPYESLTVVLSLQKVDGVWKASTFDVKREESE